MCHTLTLRCATDRTEGAAISAAPVHRADLPDQAALSELVQRIAGLGLEIRNVQIVPPPPRHDRLRPPGTVVPRLDGPERASAALAAWWEGDCMDFEPLPATAAWQHQQARTGFEVVYFQPLAEGCRIEGCTTALEEGKTWAVEYTIDLNAAGATRGARIRGRSAAGPCSALLEADGAGRWLVDGVPAPHLDGCLDVDLESSAMTNALPVRRMGLAPGNRAAAPAAYVRAVGLAVGRLEQSYLRAPDEVSRQCYEYAAPAFDFSCRLSYDAAGLVVDYPGIAVRAG